MHERGLVRRLIINTFSLAIADIANKFMSLLYFLIAARHLGPTQFGVLSFALAFVNIFTVFPDMGLGMLATREIARDRSVAKTFLANGTAMRLLGSGLVCLIILLLINLLNYPPEIRTIVNLLSLFVLLNALFSFYANIFWGFERNEFVALIRLVQTLGLAGGALLLARGAAAPLRYAWLYIGANGLAVIFAALLLAWKFVPIGISWNFPEWQRMLRVSYPFAIASILVAAYYWNASLFLAQFWKTSEVGIYNAGFRFAFGIVFPAGAFSAAMYPVISRLFLNDRGQLKKFMNRGVRYMVNLGVPITLLGTLLARPLILLLYGSKYIPAVSSFRVLLWWVGCVYLNSLLSIYFYGINKPFIPTIQPGISLVVNLLLNFLLIPRYGAVGAGISIFAAEAVGLSILLGAQFRTPGRIPAIAFLKTGFQAILSVLGTAPIAWFAAKFHPAIGVGSAFLVYPGLLILTRGIKINEIKLIMQEMFAKPST